MGITQEQYFFDKMWTVRDSGGTDVHQGQHLVIGNDNGQLSLIFPDGVNHFGDGLWDEYEDLRYDAATGTVTCLFKKTRNGPVHAIFRKFSGAGMLCRVVSVEPRFGAEDPGEWTAEDDGG